METKEKLILVLVFFLLIVFLWIKGSEYSAKASYMAKKIKEIGAKRQGLEDLSSIYRKWQETRKKFSIKKEIHSFKEDMYSVAKASGLRVISVVPRKEPLLYGLQRECISLQVSGSYSNLVSFVKAVENRGGFIYIQNLRINDKRRRTNGRVTYSIGVDLCLIQVGS